METRFGPLLAGAQARFRLWAPQLETAPRLVLAGRDGGPMDRDAGGWWQAVAPAQDGIRYGFRLPDGLTVPDPASRFQPDDVHGLSRLVDHRAYVWRHPEWRGRPWREAVVYEVHAGLCGGYAGVQERLSDLAALGITAIELMPLADFRGRRNWGYDGVLPFAPDSAYGTPDELKALIDEAHGLGLMVLLDVVYNHFGPDGNYLAAYASGFFDPSIHTPWGAAIDFKQPEVRRFFTENVLAWLGDYRLDGLRFDAVHQIADATWLTEVAAQVRQRFPHRQIHLIAENEHNAAGLLEAGFDAQWNDDFHNVLHVMLTGETNGYYADFADRPADKLLRALTEGFVYQGEGSPHQNGKKRGSPSGHLPPTAFVNFLQNHDQVGNRALGDRLTMLIPPARLKAAIALQLLCPAVPLIFMGEDVGSPTPFCFFTDFEGDLADAVREGRRREFAHDPAFAGAVGASRVPDPNDAATFTGSIPKPAPDASEWRRLYADLLNLRRLHITPHLDQTQSIGGAVIGSNAVLASWRLGSRGELTLAVNLGQDACNLPVISGRSFWGMPTHGRIAPDTTLAWLAA